MVALPHLRRADTKAGRKVKPAGATPEAARAAGAD